MTHWIPLAVLALYVLLLFVVSCWSERRATRGRSGTLGYLLAGRQLPAWVAAALLAGLAVGGASTIGVAEQAYRVGISAGWYNAAWAAGALAVGLVAARRYRRAEISTLPELFERHYGKAARVIGVTGQLAIQIVITSLQYVAGGAILTSLMPGLFSFRLGMLVTALVFVGITLVGGFWAAGLTNAINVIVIYLGIGLGAALTVARLGGLPALEAGIPEGHPGFDLLAVGPGVVVAWFLVMITQAHSTQAVVQIGFACKDERAARRAYLLGGLLILPVGFVSALIGMAALELHPGILPAQALPRVVLDLPPLVAGLVLAGLWAADVSTASALLIGSATLVTNDVLKRFAPSWIPPSREKLACRLVVLAVSALTFLLALTVRSILEMLLVGLTLSTAYTLVVLMTLFAPGLCRRSSATATLLATILSLGAWIATPSDLHPFPHPIYLTWITSLVVFFLVALLDGRRILAAPRRAVASSDPEGTMRP